MSEIFKGWRRKAGCVTLVMACVFMICWARSSVVLDRVWFPFGDMQHEVYLLRGHIAWGTWRLHGEQGQCGWGTEQLVAIPSVYERRIMTSRESLQLTYSHFVIPLTLLSAYLILWKPRKRA